MGPRAFLARVGTPLTACSVHVLSSIEFTACCEPSASWPSIKPALPSWARTIICRAHWGSPKHGWTLLYRQTAPFYHELVGPFGSETEDNHLQRPRQPREFSWEERSAPLEDHLAARHRNPRGESQRVQRRNLQRGWQLVTGTEETASGGVRVEGRNVYATHSRATDLSGESIHRVTNSFLSSYFRFTLLEYTDHCTMPRIPEKLPPAVQSPILRVC